MAISLTGFVFTFTFKKEVKEKPKEESVEEIKNIKIETNIKNETEDVKLDDEAVDQIQSKQKEEKPKSSIDDFDVLTDDVVGLEDLFK